MARCACLQGKVAGKGQEAEMTFQLGKIHDALHQHRAAISQAFNYFSLQDRRFGE